MNSGGIAMETKLASAIHQLTDGITENQLSHKESIICVSKPKIQLLELTENIKAAESNYHATMMEWDRVKLLYNRSEAENHCESTGLLSSFLSSKTLEITKSARSMNSDRDNEEDSDNDQGEDQAEDVNQVQVVLTPRSQQASDHGNVTPCLDIRDRLSLETIKTNKRSRRMSKSRKKSLVSVKANEDMLRTSLIYAAKTKKKKIHGRLKNSNSKSTIATRETIFSDKRNERRKFKKQKSIDTFASFQTPQVKKRVNPSKVRESKIHKNFVKTCNTKLKTVNPSVVSSKQSKLRSFKMDSHFYEEPNVDDCTHNTAKNDTPLNERCIAIDTEQSGIQDKREELHEKDNHHCNQIQSLQNHGTNELYDPFCPKKYEMPTEASKMKRVHRSYRRSYNIPFIVGTSISPSHNLGLNIQQLLGIIKQKQPIIPGISSLTIRKVCRCTGPVSRLFKQISSEFAQSCRNLSRQDAHRLQKITSYQDMGSCSYEHLNVKNSAPTLTNQASFKQSLICEPLYEEDEDSQSSTSDLPGKIQNYEQSNQPSDGKSRQRSLLRQKRKQQLLEEAGAGDSAAGCKFNYASNNKEMTEIFTRLHNQFEKMITQKERLEDQLEKYKDKSLAKEVAKLEELIVAKEKEINAMIKLHKEVMSLKQQTHRIRKRNSLICIGEPGIPHLSRLSLSRSANSKYHINQTPNALKHAGLLRQIQYFQRLLAIA